MNTPFFKMFKFLYCIFFCTLFFCFFAIFKTGKIDEKRLEILNSLKKLSKQGKTLHYSNRLLKLYIIHVVQSNENFLLVSKKLSDFINSLCFNNFFCAILQNDKNFYVKSPVSCIY